MIAQTLINTHSDFFIAKIVNGAVDCRSEEGQPQTDEEILDDKIRQNSI